MLKRNSQAAGGGTGCHSRAGLRLVARGSMPRWATQIELGWVRQLGPMPVVRLQQGYLLAEVWREIRMAIRSVSRKGCSRLVGRVEREHAGGLLGVGRLMLLHGPETPSLRAQRSVGSHGQQVEVENLGAVFPLLMESRKPIQVPHSRTIGQWRIRNGRVIRSGTLRRRPNGLMPRRGPLSNGVVEPHEGAMGWSIFNDGTSLLMGLPVERVEARSLGAWQVSQAGEIERSARNRMIWRSMLDS
ncbi:hypothetical protein Mmc1_0061 [Magnetococcus marinus MC-1]|uniref:Uncharacterized protein n=1 Tax=Magnetococcus marinus (strain ATCC BAA-1437 / JCM 17883 / MC-1) TaxID=156889 RepID=A0L3P7_MAGMM|nr:hypothetical protein [Magnetococcus marinus]ABK42590.1 hypothetical protein Mmc1_0061 [Magnetococcus marinus MC-1]